MSTMVDNAKECPAGQGDVAPEWVQFFGGGPWLTILLFGGNDDLAETPNCCVCEIDPIGLKRWRNSVVHPVYRP
jgi:hypothetical protein